MPFMRQAYRYFRRHFYNRVRLQIKQAIAAKTDLDQVRFLAVELIQRGYGPSVVRMAHARIYELLPDGAEFSYPPRGTYVPTPFSGSSCLFNLQRLQLSGRYVAPRTTSLFASISEGLVPLAPRPNRTFPRPLHPLPIRKTLTVRSPRASLVVVLCRITSLSLCTS
jgi:hypothetical protein